MPAARFKADPYAEARRAGLSPEECAAIVKNRLGRALSWATRSFRQEAPHQSAIDPAPLLSHESRTFSLAR